MSPDPYLGRDRHRAHAFALAAVIMASGCGDDATGAGTSGADMSATGTSVEGTAGPLDHPYGPCGDAEAPTSCDAASADVASCEVRTDPDNGQTYRVCAPACTGDADCPSGDVGNASPTCVARTCAVACNPEANVCPSGTVCVPGEPARCMWPVDAPAAHDSIEDFCATACGTCGATLLLPWSGDCEAECAADLGDCDGAELGEVFACTGGEGCPNGGGALAQCLMPLECVQGSG